jgi:hypothetical protein
MYSSNNILYAIPKSEESTLKALSGLFPLALFYFCASYVSLHNLVLDLSIIGNPSCLTKLLSLHMQTYYMLSSQSNSFNSFIHIIDEVQPYLANAFVLPSVPTESKNLSIYP